MAQMLHNFAVTSLSHLLVSRGSVPLRVLELGSGTGLLGLAAAAIWRTEVVLSDLPSIMPNLTFNVDQNRATVEALGGSVLAGALTWGGTDEESDQGLFREKKTFNVCSRASGPASVSPATNRNSQIVLVADPLYDDNHPDQLAEAIDDHLSVEGSSRVLVMAPRRDEVTVGLISAFKTAISRPKYHMVGVGEGVAMGRDDWGDDDETAAVDCWWGVFMRIAHEGNLTAHDVNAKRADLMSFIDTA